MEAGESSHGRNPVLPCLPLFSYPPLAINTSNPPQSTFADPLTLTNSNSNHKSRRSSPTSRSGPIRNSGSRISRARLQSVQHQASHHPCLDVLPSSPGGAAPLVGQQPSPVISTAAICPLLPSSSAYSNGRPLSTSNQGLPPPLATLTANPVHAHLHGTSQTISSNLVHTATTAPQVFAALSNSSSQAAKPSSLFTQVVLGQPETPAATLSVVPNIHVHHHDRHLALASNLVQFAQRAPQVFAALPQPALQAITQSAQLSHVQQASVDHSAASLIQRHEHPISSNHHTAAPFSTRQSGLQVTVEMPQPISSPIVHAVPSPSDFPPLLPTPNIIISSAQHPQGSPTIIQPLPSPSHLHSSAQGTISSAPRPSYAAAVRPPSQQQQKPRNIPPFLPDIPLVYQAPVMSNGIPLVSFSDEEMDQAEALFLDSIVLKFSRGNPALAMIREAVADWGLSKAYSVGVIDSRHVLVRMTCTDDLKRALSIEGHKIDGRLYRSFRWTPSFSPTSEPSLRAVWVQIPELPFTLFVPSFIERIATSLGTLLSMDVPTKDTSRLRIAKFCVEVDLASTLLQGIKIASRGKVFNLPIEYESNINYCSGCRLLGHSLATCRKRPIHKKAHLQPHIQTSTSATLIMPLNTHIHIASPQTLSPRAPPSETRPPMQPIPFSTAAGTSNPTTPLVDGHLRDCSDDSARDMPLSVPAAVQAPLAAAVQAPIVAAVLDPLVVRVVNSPMPEVDEEPVSEGDNGFGDPFFTTYPRSDTPLTLDNDVYFQPVKRRQRYANKHHPVEVERHGHKAKERRVPRLRPRSGL